MKFLHAYLIRIAIWVFLMVWAWILLGLMTFPRYAYPALLPVDSYYNRFEIAKLHRRFGIDQTSKLMAQEWVESRGRDDAVSPAGARGRCQFMPPTARLFERAYPEELKKWPRYGREWCLRAQALYIRDELMATWYPRDDMCARYEFAFRAYNGGRGWLVREREIAGKDATPAELRAVCEMAGRSSRACAENTAYAGKVYRREPHYLRAGYAGGPACQSQ